METTRSRSVSRSAGLVLVAVAWAVFLALTASPEAVLFTVPVFLLAAPLAFGRYLGEEVIVRLRRHSRPSLKRSAEAVPSLPDQVPAGIVSVFRLSDRAPPAASF